MGHRQDGVEISSMGALYTGRWEKKYWSSSRGKGRHPYPVGYQAIRFRDGHRYSMEISEGKSGPAFHVSCEEGFSCIGPTPTAAWEAILKKQHWGSKGSNCSISGSEMFGFSDPVVQLLLRQLLSGVSQQENSPSPPLKPVAKVAEVAEEKKRKTELFQPTVLEQSQSAEEEHSETGTDMQELFVADTEVKENVFLRSQPEYIEDDTPDSLTRSMISLLLPKAVPLLKQRRSKKRKKEHHGNEQEKHFHSLLELPALDGSFQIEEIQEKTIEEEERIENAELEMEDFEKTEKEVENERIEQVQEIEDNDKMEKYEKIQEEEGYLKIVDEQIKTTEDDDDIDLELPALDGRFQIEEIPEKKIEEEERIEQIKEVEDDDKMKKYEKIQKEKGYLKNDDDIDEEKLLIDMKTMHAAKERDFIAAEVKQSINDRDQQLVDDKVSVEAIMSIEHPLPVLSVVLNLQKTEIDLCVCCGVWEQSQRYLFLYRISTENSETQLVQSLQLMTQEEHNPQLEIEECGIRYTPDGKKVILLGCFAMKTRRGYEGDYHAVRMVSLATIEMQVILEAVDANKRRCLLVKGRDILLAAGDKGCISGWHMDTNWSHSTPFNLPSAIHKGVCFCTISRLLEIPETTHLVVGCDYNGSFATWDIEKRQLLNCFHTSDGYLCRAEMMNMGLVTTSERMLCVLVNIRERKRKLMMMMSGDDDDDDVLNGYWAIARLKNERVEMRSKVTGGTRAVASMGRYGVSGMEDGNVMIWEMKSGNILLQLAELEEYSCPISHVATDATSSLLATCQQGRVIIYVAHCG